MPAPTTLAGHSAAIRALAERWLPAVAAPGRDVVVSPAGLWLALTAVAAGADGDTAAELRALLGTAGEDAGAAATGAARELAGTDALAVATGVWARTPVFGAFRDSLPDIGFGTLDPAGIADIDAWVRDATGGLIPRLPARPRPGTLLLLVNVLYLKARWESVFDAARTAPRDFTDAAGRTHRVATMSRTLPPDDAWAVPGRAASVVELRCAGERAAVVRCVLGEPGAEPAEVLPAAWAPREERAAFDVDEIRLRLPRLSLRTNTDVLPHLAALGVTRAVSGGADFSLMAPEPLMIGQVVQEAVVKVAEEGVEAAAATAVMMMRSAAVVRERRVREIAFDRPFGLVVLDATGAVPLFTAWQAGAPRDVS
jgi:serine protease inhibitor